MSDPRPGSGLPGDEHGRLDPADLPEELRSQDAELRTMARAEDIEPPPGLASRITQAMERQAAMGGPAVFLEAARGRSGRGMVRGFTASARSIFARGVPVMARLQAALLVVVVSLVLATGATVGATGAQAVIGVVQSGPAPTEDPTQPSERPTDPPARPSGSPGASPSGPLGSPGASALPSASPSALPSVSPGPSVSGSWVMASPSAIAPGESASGEVSTLPPKAASPEPASTDLVPPGSP